MPNSSGCSSHVMNVYLLVTTGSQRPKVLAWTMCMWKKSCVIQQVAWRLRGESHWWKCHFSLLMMLTCIFVHEITRLCS